MQSVNVLSVPLQMNHKLEGYQRRPSKSSKMLLEKLKDLL